MNSHFWILPLSLSCIFFILLKLSLEKSLYKTLSKQSKIHIVLCSLFLSITAAELIARHWNCKTDSLGLTIGARCWYKKFWNPINKQGFRDLSWSKERFLDKEIVLVTGDSFVAGTGIENISNRFPEKLKLLLGENWEVVVLAKRNTGPIEQAKYLESFPYKANVIIHSYFINDIEDAMPFCNIPIHRYMNFPVPQLTPYIQHSYLLSFLYWRGVRRYKNDFADAYFHSLGTAQNSQRCMQIHQQQIMQLIKQGQSKGARSLVLLFPNLIDIDNSRQFIRKIENLLESHNIPSLNLTPIIEELPVAKRIVNSIDAHPSSLLNQIVAKHLYKVLKAGYF